MRQGCKISSRSPGQRSSHLQLDRESAKARAKVQKSLTGRGNKVLSCPECGKVVRYLADHLANAHHIYRGTEASLDMRKKAKLSLELSTESQPPAEVMRRKDNTRSTAIVKDYRGTEASLDMRKKVKLSLERKRNNNIAGNGY